MPDLVIGLPLVFSSPHVDEKNVAKSHLLSVKLVPKVAKFVSPTQSGAFRIFSLHNVQNEPGAPTPTVIYFEPTQIQETFSNDLTEHFLSQVLKTSERLGQIFQSLGGTESDMKQLQTKLENSIIGKIGNILPQSVKNMGKNMTEAVFQMLQGHRFDFPKMWSDSRADTTYELTTKLFCNNPNDDTSFEKFIIKPLENLLKFVLPRASGRDHYQWPFFCSAKAEGLFYLPEAMVTSISVNKGMGVNFGVNNRPNIVELTIQITSIRSVMVNDSGEQSDLPYKLTSYLDNLKSPRSRRSVNNLNISHTGQSVQQQRTTIPPQNLSADQRATFDSLRNFYYI